MATHLLSINASDWNNFEKKFPQVPENKLFYENQKNSKTSYFWSILNVFIYHHQLLNVFPVLFLLSIFKVIQLTPYFMILSVLIFNVNQNLKLLNWHSIVLLFSFVHLPFCFLYFFLIIVCVIAVCNYYCYLLNTVMSYSLIYLFIHIHYIIYLVILWSWLV